MNYLGHLLITYPHEELTMGNLLGDMLRAREIIDLPDEIRRGVEVHHFIDRFTDSHSGVRRLVGVMREGHGKYAPVVIDVLLDHVLSLQWHEHAGLGYPAFTDWVYHQMVPAQVEKIPESSAKRISNMAAHRWLDGYPSLAGMTYVMERMDRRASFPSRFVAALEDYDLNKKLFEIEFKQFYRDLKLAVAKEFHLVDVAIPPGGM